MDPLSALDRAGHERDASLEPAQRARRGIVHTPSAVARWIAAACEGLGEDATLVDPACGPGIFLAAALSELRTPPARTLGIDVDEGAIALARRELAPRFSSAGWPLELRVGDALDEVPSVPGAAIVIGNPPWTARTASRGVSEELLADFRRDAHGEALGERKIGVLSDAYVRFVRWAVAVVERAPRGGIVAMVVSSSFLDGRVHRGMRSYLMGAFDRIDLVDLGGSALVARKSGARDENVFGVRPGAVIFVGRRDPGGRARAASVRTAALRGARADKLAALGTLARDDARFRAITPSAPLFRFVPGARTALPAEWPTLDAWMPWSREGVQTNRDALCIGSDRDELIARVRAFVASPDRALARRHFDPESAAARLRAEPAPLERFVTRIAYRPFEEHWLFAHPALCHRARPEIAEALAREPLALITASKDRGERPFAHLGVVTAIADNCWLSSRSSCRARLLPARTPDGSENVGEEVRAALEEIAGRVGGREVIAWLAAWLASATFRARFDEALRAGPIRVPLPRAADELRAGIAAGERVIAAFVGEGEGESESDGEGESDGESLVIGHRRLAPSPRTRALAAAQLAADEIVGDLIGSRP